MAQMNSDFTSALYQRLRNVLSCAPNLLVGCLRQNKMQSEGGYQTSWRILRGNALLNTLGTKVAVSYPLGVFHAYLRLSPDEPVTLLQFRGGDYKTWWDEDARVMAACISTYTNYKVDNITILHENKGILNIYSILPVGDPQGVVSKAMNGYHAIPAERIAKNKKRGLAWCQYCTVRGACDRADMENGQMSDWPKSKFNKG